MAHLHPEVNGVAGQGSVTDELQPISEKLRQLADELKIEQNGPNLCQQVRERLRQLADELKARDEADAEMRANYPHFKKAVYAMLREQFEAEVPPLSDKDLDDLAAEEGALPLEAFIHELEQ